MRSPLFSLRELAADAQALIQTLDDVTVATNPSPLPRTEKKETSKVSSLGQDPSDGTHKHQHRATIPLRTAWPNGVEQPKYPFYVPQLNNTH